MCVSNHLPARHKSPSGARVEFPAPAPSDWCPDPDPDRGGDYLAGVGELWLGCVGLSKFSALARVLTQKYQYIAVGSALTAASEVMVMTLAPTLSMLSIARNDQEQEKDSSSIDARQPSYSSASPIFSPSKITVHTRPSEPFYP